MFLFNVHDYTDRTPSDPRSRAERGSNGFNSGMLAQQPQQPRQPGGASPSFPNGPPQPHPLDDASYLNEQQYRHPFAWRQQQQQSQQGYYDTHYSAAPSPPPYERRGSFQPLFPSQQQAAGATSTSSSSSPTGSTSSPSSPYPSGSSPSQNGAPPPPAGCLTSSALPSGPPKYPFLERDLLSVLSDDMNKGENGAALSHHPAHSHHPQPSPYSPPQERQTPSSFSSSSFQDFHNSSFAYSGSVAKHLANATAAGLRSIQELPPPQQYRQSPASSKSSSSSTSSSPSDIYAYTSFHPPHHPHAPPHHQQVVVEDEEDQPHPFQHQDHYYHRYQQPSSSAFRYPPRHHHDHYHPHHHSQRFEGAFFSEGGAGDAAAHPSHYDPHLSPHYSHLHHHPEKHSEGEAFRFTHQPPPETRTMNGEEEPYAIAPRFHSNEVDHRYHQHLNGYVVEEFENEEEGEEETGKTATVTVKPEKSSSSLSSSPSAADTFAARLHRQANKKKKNSDVNENRAKRRPRGKLQGEERAKQNREASRRYRQRKKELLMHMKKEIQRLLHEKASLLKQQESTLSIINRLQNQNTELQQEHKHQAKQLEKERLSWVRRLVKAMHDDTTTEEELNHIVNTVGAYCVRICNLSQSHINWLLSPGTAKELLKAGYFDSEAARVEHPEREESYASFVQKLMQKISELDEEQIRRLQDAVHQHYEKLVPIQEQRFELIDELRALVQQTEEDSIGEEEADEGEEEEEDEGGMHEAFQDRKFCKAMKMLCTLEMLRDNFQREADQCRQDMANLIMNVLRLQQRARFFTEVEFVHISVMQLKSVWAQLHPSLPSDYREPSPHLPPRYLYPQILPLKHAEAEDGNGDGYGGNDGNGGVDNDEECS